MKKVLIPLCIACMTLAFSSCRSSKETAGISSINGEWDIVEVNGAKVNVAPGQNIPYVGFESATGRISGNSGCNRMMGSFDVNAEPGKLDLAGIASTRMLCGDMTTENNVLNAFKNVKGYKLMGKEKLALTNSLNRPVVVLEKRTAKAQLAALQGEWKVIEAGGQSIPTDLEERQKPYINFNIAKKSIHGNAGCNMINGGFNLDDKNPQAISFPAVAATMMACPNMEVERRVMNALNNTKSFRLLTDIKVAFYNEEGATTMVLSK